MFWKFHFVFLNNKYELEILPHVNHSICLQFKIFSKYKIMFIQFLELPSVTDSKPNVFVIYYSVYTQPKFRIVHTKSPRNSIYSLYFVKI